MQSTNRDLKITKIYAQKGLLFFFWGGEGGDTSEKATSFNALTALTCIIDKNGMSVIEAIHILVR